jgi:hypothetical protein
MSRSRWDGQCGGAGGVRPEATQPSKHVRIRRRRLGARLPVWPTDNLGSALITAGVTGAGASHRRRHGHGRMDIRGDDVRAFTGKVADIACNLGTFRGQCSEVVTRGA